jgi:ketosteroid isomerase-like protein
MNRSNLYIVIVFVLLIFGIFMNSPEAQNENSTTHIKDELKAIEQVIHNVFGWAVNKDFKLFFSSISDDSNFISVTPYKRVKFGVEDVKKDTSFWASPDFKAIRHEIRDLKIHFSSSSDVAWFYCMLDDINTWKEEPASWENVRWTGVLEKRKGVWRVVMQHFSWPKEN